MLVLTRKPNQSIQIGDGITVSVVRVKGNTIQLGIEAPKSVNILRSELLEKNGQPGKPDDSDASGNEIQALEMPALDTGKDDLPRLNIVRLNVGLSHFFPAR